MAAPIAEAELDTPSHAAPQRTQGGGASARVMFNDRWIVTAAEGGLLADLGWSAERIVGKRVARLLSRSLRQAARPVLRVIGDGASVRVDVMQDSRLLHIDAHRVLPTDDGAVARLDITDLTWDDASEHEQAQLERLEAIGYVAMGIGHEINTPVQFVSDNLRFLESSLHDLLRLTGELQDSLAAPLEDGRLREQLQAALSRVDTAFIQVESEPAFEAIQTGLARISRVTGDLRAFAKPARDRAPIRVSDEITLAVGLARNELRRRADVTVDVADALPALTGRAGDLAQVLVRVLREVVAHARTRTDRSPAHPPEVRLQAFARRDWLFISAHSSPHSCAPMPLTWNTMRAAEAPVRPMLADGFNVVRALLREHYGGHLVVIHAPDAQMQLTIGLPLHSDRPRGATA